MENSSISKGKTETSESEVNNDTVRPSATTARENDVSPQLNVNSVSSLENEIRTFAITAPNETSSTSSSSIGVLNLDQAQFHPPNSHAPAFCNSSCLQSRLNESVLNDQSLTTNIRQTRTGRRQSRWQRRRVSRRFPIREENINFRIPVGGSIRYWNYYPQTDDGVVLPHERNAPPTYTPRMSNTCPFDLHCSSFIAPMPPPTYAQAVGDTDIEDLPEPFLELRALWGHRRQPAYCFVCRSRTITQVTHRVTKFTHISALILCFLGCWPCCLFPYCFNYFKTTYHYCSRCSTRLGVYSALSND